MGNVRTQNKVIKGNREYDKKYGFSSTDKYSFQQMRRDDKATKGQSPRETRMGLPKIDRRADKYKKSY
jgi:hypothetical protein